MKVRVNCKDYDFWQFDKPDHENYLDFVDEIREIDSIEFGYVKVISPLNFYILPCICKDYPPYSWHNIIYDNIMTSLGYSGAVIRSIINNIPLHNTRPLKNFSSARGVSVIVEEFKQSITCREHILKHIYKGGYNEIIHGN